MFTMHQPLPVHEPLFLCPSCETAMLCRTSGEVSAKSTVAVLLCPSCNVYHSIDRSSSQCVLLATPVAV